MDDIKLNKAIELRNAINEFKGIKKQDMRNAPGPHNTNLLAITFGFIDHPRNIFISGATANMIIPDLFENIFEDIDATIAKLEKMYAEL